MDENQKIKQFSKYISKIIMPRFPDILGFEITYGDERKIKKKIYNPETPVYNFWFFMDGTEDDIEFEIRDEILHMKRMFGEDLIALFDFKTIN